MLEYFDLYGLGNSNQYYARASSKFTFDFSSDIPIIRSPEMMIEIEANARLGKESGQHYVVFITTKPRSRCSSFRKYRNALIEEILIERRKELYGEIGVEWFDETTRKGTRTGNHRVGSSANLLPDDKVFP